MAVVFEQGYPNQSLYRRYAIKTVEGIDDFRSMRETVLRRYRGMIESQLPLPQLILIDGGPEQLAFARQALAEVPVAIRTIALAKRDELIFTESDKPPLRLDWNDPALRLLQRVRDESHRFAITTHRRKRVSRLSRSALEDVPGIGKHKAALLLSTFGSVQRIAALSAEELQKAPGIGPVQAAKILGFLTETPEPEASETKKTVELVRAERPPQAVAPETARYRWDETIDVPYREMPPERRDASGGVHPAEAAGTPAEEAPGDGRAVRKTYDPKRKRGIHRA